MTGQLRRQRAAGAAGDNLRQSAALCDRWHGHTAAACATRSRPLRRQLHRGPAAGVRRAGGAPGRTGRPPVRVAPGGGGGGALFRMPSTTRRLRRAGAWDRWRSWPTRSTLRRRWHGSGEWRRGRALPGLEPLPRLGRDAAGPLPAGGHPRRPGIGRVRGPELSLFPRCGPAPSCRVRSAWMPDQPPAAAGPWTGCAWAATGALAPWDRGCRGLARGGPEADVIAVTASRGPGPGRGLGRPGGVMSRLVFAAPGHGRAAWVRGGSWTVPGLA